MPGKSGRDDEKSNARNTSENTSWNTKNKTNQKKTSVWLREQREIEYGQNTGVEDYKDSGKCFR